MAHGLGLRADGLELEWPSQDTLEWIDPIGYT